MSTVPPRHRIIDAAFGLVAEGGYEALQVRAITRRASVSSRTIYTYFPSLDSLLIIAIAEHAGAQGYDRLTRAPSRKRTSAARVQEVIDELSRVMTENRTLTQALLRALLSGKPDVAEHVRAVSAATQALLATAIRAPGERHRRADLDAAEILEATYFTALIGWASGTHSEDHMRTLMRKAIARILPG